MENINYNVYFFVIVFTLVFILIYLMYLHRLKKILKNKSKRNKKEYEIMEVNYLSVRKNIDKKKILNKTHILIISLLDALIIASVSTVINLIDLNIMWQLCIGFVLLFLLIYSLFDIYGNILVARGYEQERKKEDKNVKHKRNRK